MKYNGRKWRGEEEKLYCYLCGKIITGFSSKEAEKIFNDKGICEICQKQIRKDK